MHSRTKTRLSIIGIIIFSYLVSTFPIVNYIKDSLLLQDVERNIFNVSGSYYDLVRRSSDLRLWGYFLNEWLWAYLAVFFSKMIGSPEAYFIIIGGVNFFVYSYFIYKENGLKPIFLLLIPIQFFFLIYQPRLAFGCSLWLIGIMSKKVKIRYALFILSLMIHNAMFVIVGSYLVLKKIYALSPNKYTIKTKLYLTVLYSLAVNFVVGPLVAVFSNFLGKNRQNYENANFSSSATSLIFWGGISVLLILDVFRNKKNIEVKLFAIFFTLFPVFSYVLSSGYPYRFLTVGMPFVVIAVLNCSTVRRILLLFLLILFGIYTSLETFT